MAKKVPESVEDTVPTVSDEMDVQDLPVRGNGLDVKAEQSIKLRDMVVGRIMPHVKAENWSFDAADCDAAFRGVILDGGSVSQSFVAWVRREVVDESSTIDQFDLGLQIDTMIKLWSRRLKDEPIDVNVFLSDILSKVQSLSSSLISMMGSALCPKGESTLEFTAKLRKDRLATKVTNAVMKGIRGEVENLF